MANATLLQHSDTLINVSNDLDEIAADLAGVSDTIAQLIDSSSISDPKVGNILNMVAHMAHYSNDAIGRRAERVKKIAEASLLP